MLLSIGMRGRIMILNIHMYSFGTYGWGGYEPNNLSLCHIAAQEVGCKKYYPLLLHIAMRIVE